MADRNFKRRHDAAKRVEDALRAEGRAYEAGCIEEIRRTASAQRTLLVSKDAELRSLRERLAT